MLPFVSAISHKTTPRGHVVTNHNRPNPPLFIRNRPVSKMAAVVTRAVSRLWAPIESKLPTRVKDFVNHAAGMFYKPSLMTTRSYGDG